MVVKCGTLMGVSDSQVSCFLIAVLTDRGILLC